jgi:hypothetical protein
MSLTAEFQKPTFLALINENEVGMLPKTEKSLYYAAGFEFKVANVVCKLANQAVGGSSSIAR